MKSWSPSIGRPSNPAASTIGQSSPGRHGQGGRESRGQHNLPFISQTGNPMKRAGFLLVHLIVLRLSTPIYGDQPNKPEDRIFTLGTPQFVKEKNSDDTYT